MKLIWLAAGSAVLAACASMPTPEEVTVADYGQAMSPSDCTAAAEATISYTLKDPSSAQYRHGPACVKGYWGSVPLLGMPVAYGWLQTGEVNAKNSYGGYVGFRAYQALIRDGRVVRYCVNSANGNCVVTGA